MLYMKINEEKIPAEFYGKSCDRDWDGRESRRAELQRDYDSVSDLLHDGMSWSIIDEWEDGDGSHTEMRDCSDFCVLGDVTIHADGGCSVMLGKETELEKVLRVTYGGEE